jgi:hypothetical protein
MVDKLAAALAKAQSAITCPDRNREVEVKTNKGYTYTFKYTTLDHIIEHVRKPLTENGLWFTQILEGDQGKYRLVTRLMHSSGQYVESHTPLLVENPGNQQFGSALTYMRRYSLTAMLGLAADEDDDANAADGNQMSDTAKPKPKRQSKPKPQGKPKPAPKEQPDGYEKVMGTGLTDISKINTPVEANAMLAKLHDYEHVGDSRKDLWKALQDRARICEIQYDEAAKEFIDPNTVPPW